MEKYFIEKLKTSGEYSTIGTYWERSNQNELDIVAINEITKKVLIAEVKLNARKIDLEVVKQKSLTLSEAFKSYAIEYRGYSLQDM